MKESTSQNFLQPPPTAWCCSRTPGTVEVHMAGTDVAVLALQLCCEEHAGSGKTCVGVRERQETRKT